MKKFTALFLVKDEEVLLAQKKTGLGIGRYNGVGGKVELDETIEQAMIRECQEEIDVIPTRFHPAAEVVFREYNDGEPYVVHAHVFLASAWRGIPKESEEMADPRWFAIDSLPFNQMWPDIQYWLPRVLAGELLHCEFVLDKDDQLLSKQVQRITSLDF